MCLSQLLARIHSFCMLPTKAGHTAMLPNEKKMPRKPMTPPVTLPCPPRRKKVFKPKIVWECRKWDATKPYQLQYLFYVLILAQFENQSVAYCGNGGDG